MDTLEPISSVPVEPDQPGAQLARNEDLIDRLTTAGFQGGEYDKLNEDLRVYGVRVIKSMIRTGEIRELCYQQGVPLDITLRHLGHLRTSSEDRDELTIRTVVWAVEYFTEKALKQHGWSAKRDATLRTYFIGSCAFGFHHEFRLWRRERRAREVELLSLEVGPNIHQGHGGGSLDPAELVAMRDTISRILAHASIEMRLICTLILQGLTHAEIGTQIGNLNSRAIEGKLYRFRTKLRRLARNGAIPFPPMQTWPIGLFGAEARRRTILATPMPMPSTPTAVSSPPPTWSGVFAFEHAWSAEVWKMPGPPDGVDVGIDVGQVRRGERVSAVDAGD